MKKTIFRLITGLVIASVFTTVFTSCAKKEDADSSTTSLIEENLFAQNN